MTVLSLFDGISCARVALDRLGIDCKYYACEIDKYAIQVAKKNYPSTIHLGDVKSITADMFDKPIDLLIGGSPCQDLSIANAGRKGLDGERSGLFWEYVRIWKELKPKYFVLENVNSMSKDAKRIITETMGVEPIMINASLVSAQNRKRLFWTNIPGVVLPDDRHIYLKDVVEDCCNDKCTLKTDNILTPKESHSSDIYSVDGKSPPITSNGGGVGSNTGVYVVGAAKRSRYKGTDKLYGHSGSVTEKVVETRDEKANALTSVQTDSMVLQNTIIRKLTPIECERLQSLDDGYTEGISNSQRYKCLGNAFNVEVVRHILSFIETLKKEN